MSVWYVIPSAKPADEAQRCIDAWRQQGYKVAVWRDSDAQPVRADFTTHGLYPGYAKAVNALALTVLSMDPACDWVVTGGDDVFPDTSKHPDRIARECSRYFGGEGVIRSEDAECLFGSYGVMQPIGDSWGGGDRVAWSPWMGREWCLKANQGAGPLHPDYFHMFVDEHLQGAAKAQGCFWQRKDLTHTHKHWVRENRPMPGYLRAVNTDSHWNEAKAIFNRHQAGGFRESWPA